MKPLGAAQRSDYWESNSKASRGRETNRVRKDLTEEIAHADPVYLYFTDYSYHDRALISEHVIESILSPEGCICCRMEQT